jgi:Pirin C-terminal cupin domain
VAKNTSLCQFIIYANTTVYLFGGEPFAEERYIYWNFVATTTALIENAKQQWVEQTFPKIPGETGFIPLPEIRAHLKEKK